jgi:hypothetical protein
LFWYVLITALRQTSSGNPWDASNGLERKLNTLLERLEIPKIDIKLLAKFVGKDRTIKQATRSEKRAASLASLRLTIGGAENGGWKEEPFLHPESRIMISNQETRDGIEKVEKKLTAGC